MMRTLLALALAATAGCSDPNDPLDGLPIYPGWSLTMLDGQVPPIPESGGGSLISSGLLFLQFAPSGPGQGAGVVRYIRHVLLNGAVDAAIVELDFTIESGELHISLCPRFSSCVVESELAGPVAGGTAPLVLTSYVAGQAGSVLRFEAALPE